MKIEQLDPTIKAKLLAKFRFSRQQHADLNKVEATGEYGFDSPQPGFTYLDSGLYIQGPYVPVDDPTAQPTFILGICNEYWDLPATEAGLADLEEKLFEWALSEGFFDEDLVPKKLERETDDPDFFYWTVRIGVHKSWVADGFDLTQDEAHERLRAVLPHCHGSEFSAEVLASPLAETILREQGYQGEQLTEALRLRREVPEGEEQP